MAATPDLDVVAEETPQPKMIDKSGLKKLVKATRPMMGSDNFLESRPKHLENRKYILSKP
jgi:hypothetical protein